MPNSQKRGRRFWRLGFNERRNSLTGAEGSSEDIEGVVRAGGAFSLSLLAVVRLILLDDVAGAGAGDEDEDLLSSPAPRISTDGDRRRDEELVAKFAADQVNCE
jgi:hypothetical protein